MHSQIEAITTSIVWAGGTHHFIEGRAAYQHPSQTFGMTRFYVIEKEANKKYKLKTIWSEVTSQKPF